MKRLRWSRGSVLAFSTQVRGFKAMTSLKFTVVPHPPYSPDLAPSDFWLFPNLKQTLKGQHFLSDAEVEAAVRKWISSKPETFFINGMEKWIERVAINGYYVEK